MEDNKVYTTQGTRLKDEAPWMSYENEMHEKLNKELEEEIAEYAQHRYEPEKASNQSLEELQMWQELNYDSVRDYRWLKPEEYEDHEQRLGRIMHSSVFINFLRKAGVDCFYRQHVHVQKAVLWVVGRNGEAKIAAWVQQGFMPELSIMNFDDKGLPTTERQRGWRTVLLQLILQGMISEEKANEVFGRPKQTPAFDRYNKMLYELRKNQYLGG